MEILLILLPAIGLFVYLFIKSRERYSPIGAFFIAGLRSLGFIFILFGIIDFIGMFLGYDITGVRWTPVVAFLIGSSLVKIGLD